MKNCFGHGRVKKILYTKLKKKSIYHTEMTEIFLLVSSNATNEKKMNSELKTAVFKYFCPIF